MKTFAFFAFALILSLNVVSSSCINSVDDYAVEVVLNKPDTSFNLGLLSSAQNVFLKDNQYVIRSFSNQNLALILESESKLTTGLPDGLSIRLQMPVNGTQSAQPYLKFIPTTIKGALNLSKDEEYHGWKISCIAGNPIPQCEFDKGNTIVLASLISKNKYEVTIETNEVLTTCHNCDGRCMNIGSDTKCFPSRLKSDLGDIMKYANLVSTDEDIFSSYRIIIYGSVLSTELSPEKEQAIDWKQTLEQDLYDLRANNIISLSLQDIEEIAELAKPGSSGTNSRIIFGEDQSGTRKWTYYSQTKLAELTRLVNCNEFQSSTVPKEPIKFEESSVSNYYLVPVIILISFIIVFAILTIIARLIAKTDKSS